MLFEQLTCVLWRISEKSLLGRPGKLDMVQEESKVVFGYMLWYHLDEEKESVGKVRKTPSMYHLMIIIREPISIKKQE